jgi:GAF domain-containing protein
VLPLADELSAVFARASGLLLSEQAVSSALRVITSLVAATVPGVLGAGISVIDEDQRRTAAASDPAVEGADELQYRLGEGPCLAAAAERVLVRVDTIPDETRWPRWCPVAAAAGLRSAMSAPLVAGDRCLGALKVYSDRSRCFDDRAEHLLTLFASQGAILLASGRRTDAARHLSVELTGSLRSRDVINIATGIVMANDRVGEDVAVATLIDVAEREGRTLLGSARALVRATGRGGR